MIMKIINTAREITFFAGSNPGILRFNAVSAWPCKKNGTRSGRKRGIPARSVQIRVIILNPKMMIFSIKIEKIENFQFFRKIAK